MHSTFNKILLTLFFAVFSNHPVWADSAKVRLSVTPISKNVYSIISPSFGLPTEANKGWNSNSHFVVTDDGVLVFDTGSSTSIGLEIKNAIKSVTDKPVRWLVNSHSHADHWLGNAAFADTKPEIIASAESLAVMKKVGKEDVAAFYRMTNGATGMTHLIYPTSLLLRQEKRTLGGVDVEFIFSDDGHSSGDILIWLPQQKIIVGGDVLSSDWMPIITPGANVPNLISTLNKVTEFKPSIVLTGHGRATTVKSVRRDVELLSTVLKRVKGAVEQGKKLNQISLEVGLAIGPKYRPLYKNFDEHIKEQVKVIYQYLNN